MTLEQELRKETGELFDYYAQIIRDEILRNGNVLLNGTNYKPNISKGLRPTALSGFNYVAPRKFLEFCPNIFEKQILQVRLDGLRRIDQTIRNIGVVRLNNYEIWVDPTIEEFFVDRSQDINLVGISIKRVYIPGDTYPLRVVGKENRIRYSR
ncbi:hypothetical protein HQ489_03290 [Candidatus Woesearchaeota archaeon]|nr:hypothetical protein [Candidatus Woesearchaeota archaeon]